MLQAKKLLSLLLLLSMLLSLFAACTPNNNEDESTDTETETETETDTETETEPVPEDVKIVDAGAAEFTVVYPFDYDNLSFVAKDYAEQIAQEIRKLTQATVKQKDDYVPKNETHDASAPEILVGLTSYAETSELLGTVGYGDYAIGFVGKKLVVTASTTTALSVATTKVLEILNGGYSEGENSISLPGDLYVTETVVPMLNKLPKYEAGDSFSLTDAGDGSYVLAVGDVDLEAHNAYLELIKATFTLKEERNILNDDNQYALYTNGTEAVTAIHTTYNDASRIIIEPIASNGYYTYENKSGAGSNVPILIQVGLNPAGSETQNGMCYVVRLSNGKFMIWDGGHDDTAYKEGQNCQRLMNVLKGYAPNPSNVRIACWLITHPHTDHIGVLQYFCNNLSKFPGVTVENILLNLPSDIQAMQDTSSDGLEVKMNKYRDVIKKLTDKGTTVLHKSHPGQVYEFADAKLEILYSHDMRAEKPLKESNNLSIVSRLTVAGQTILFNGDTHTRSNEVMIKMYGKDLKVDFYQAPHHGYGPNDTRYPELAAPKYTLIPIGPDDVDHIKKNAWMTYLFSYSKTYTAQFNTTVFLLPFDGQESSLRVVANAKIQ